MSSADDKGKPQPKGRRKMTVEGVSAAEEKAKKRLEPRAIQEILGDHQDSVVLRTVLRDLGMRAHLAGENGFTFGRLHALAQIRAAHDEGLYVGALAGARKAAHHWPG